MLASRRRLADGMISRLSCSKKGGGDRLSAGIRRRLSDPTPTSILIRLYASNANHLMQHFMHINQVPWHDTSPHATSQSQIMCLSKAAEKGAIQDRRWYKRFTKFLRTFYRACQVTVMISPLFVTFPFMYLTREIFPWLRRKWWAYALWSIEALGPCMVKFMQWASTRRDILAPEVCDMLEPIQGQTRPHSWKKTLLALNTLRDDWEQVLTISEDHCMLGSGSVAQVYKGTAIVTDPNDPTDPPLRKTVAVKVIHPTVKKQIEADLELMRFGAWIVESTGHFQWWSISDFVEEFAEIMSMQLDLRKEARALDRFRENFKKHHDIFFPQPLWPLVNEFVMVEDYVHGTPISAILKDPSYPDIEKRRLAKSGLSAFLKMVFLDNFVHGDLHPGNIHVTENLTDKNHPNLTFIDAGIVTELTPQDRRNFVDLFYAIATGKGEEAGRLMIERARNHECEDPDSFCKGINKIVNEAVGSHLRLGKIRVGFLIQKVLGLCLQYKVKLESNFAAILLAIGVLEGVGRSLDPELDILTAATPVILKSHFFSKNRSNKQEAEQYSISRRSTRQEKEARKSAEESAEG